MEKKTLVIGASENPERYSNMAIRLLREHNQPVVAIGRGEGTVGDIAFSAERTDWKDIDTVSLYVNPKAQKEYYDYLLRLHPHRIIFNPGTENPELEELARQNNIEPLEACTLVLLNTGQF